MEKKIAIISALSLFAAVALLNVSCAQPPSPAKTPSSTPGPLVGVVLPATYTRWVQDGKTMSDTLVSLNYRCTVLTGDDTAEVEITNIQDLVKAGAKALIVAPVNNDAPFLKALASAKATGVKIISYDRWITNSPDVDFYTSFNNVQVGEIMGQYLVDQGGAGKDIPLYLYAGSETDNNAFRFFKGSWNKLQPKILDGTFVIQNSAKANELKNTLDLTDTQITSIFTDIAIHNWNPTTAASLATRDLGAVSTVKGNVFILAPNDMTGRSIYDKFKADTAVTSIVITGQDGEAESIQRIIDGKQSMTIFKNTRTLAAETAKIAVALIEGKSPTTDTTLSNGSKDVSARLLTPTLITKTNVKAEMFDSGYYDPTKFDLTNLNK